MSYQINRSIIWLFILFLFLSVLCISTVAKEISITTKSDKAKELFIKGRSLADNLQSVEAAHVFDEAIKADPNFALAHVFRALTGIGGFNVVHEHLNTAMKLADKVTEGEKNLIYFASAMIDGNQMKEKMYLDNLLNSFPDNKRVQLWAGVYHYNLNDFSTAKNYISKAVQLDSKFAPAYNMLGYTDSKLNDYKGAETAFKTYISLVPDNPNPYDSYAELLLNMGKYDDAIKQYQMALSKDSKFTSSLDGIGHCYVFKGNYDEARKNYQKCFDISNDINSKLNALAWIATSYVHQGNTSKAISTIEQERMLAQKNHLTSNEINSLNTEAFILTEAGKPDEGIKKLDMASDLIKKAMLPADVTERLTLLTDLNRNRALISAGKLDEAQKSLTSLKDRITKRNNTFEIEALNGDMALLDIKKGNYREAIDHFNKSDLTSDVNQYYMGVAYEKMGNKMKADECFQKVKNSRSNNLGLAVVRSRATE